MAKKSLKDQLMDAGFRSHKMENHRASAKGREVKQAEKHQVTRNYCEHCGLIHPDVERYRHNMPTTEAEWICLACVDKLMIDDRFRVTQQSDMAKRGMFRRYFGQTRDLTKEEGHAGARGPRRDANGNRSQNGERRPNNGQNRNRNDRNDRNDRSNRGGGRPHRNDRNDRPRRSENRNGNGSGNRDENGDINGNR